MKRQSLVLPIAALLGVVLTTGCFRRPAPDERTGISIGARAPEFSLAANDGQMHTLAGILEGGPVALVFTRSADW